MVQQLDLAGIVVDVVFKDIKNVHLSVYPPTGRVRISAPLRMNLDIIRVFAISKLDWIRQQQKKFQDQDREAPREYLDRESHYVWGKRYLLKVVEEDAAPNVELQHSKMILRVRPGLGDEAKQAIISRWYRLQIRRVVPQLIAKWESVIEVKVEHVFIQKMKTKWGSCNNKKCSIRLNTDLAKKPPECLEYIVVHEMTHLRERNHNDRFRALMQRYMPHWIQYREMLNKAPLGHEDWGY